MLGLEVSVCDSRNQQHQSESKIMRSFLCYPVGSGEINGNFIFLKMTWQYMRRCGRIWCGLCRKSRAHHTSLVKSAEAMVQMPSWTTWWRWRAWSCAGQESIKRIVGNSKKSSGKKSSGKKSGQKVPAVRIQRQESEQQRKVSASSGGALATAMAILKWQRLESRSQRVSSANVPSS